MPTLSASALLVGSILLLHATQSNALLNVACESITGIPFCTECSRTPKRCYLCHKNKAPVWSSTGVITSCKATTTGATCTKASGDANCVRCDGIWCTECKAGFVFDANYRCVNAGGNCARLSGNANCAACNPDGTCTKCKGHSPAYKLVALNALYINAGFPQTRCLTLAQLNQYATAITWKNAVVPTNCIEVDSEFKCNRCVDGMSLSSGVCRPLASGSKCSTATPFYQYCARCNPANPRQCLQCNGARGLLGGQCRLPCRMLYGIGCKGCNAVQCTVRDPAYANGRR